MKKHSIIVVGGGPIGLTAAILLEKNSIDVAIVLDRHRIEKNIEFITPARLFAVAERSRDILNNLKLKNIESNSQKINHIRIVDNNSTAKVDFDPADIDLEDFGYMIDEKVLIKILYSKLLETSVTVYESGNDIDISEDEFFIKLNNLQIKSQLLIAANGKCSKIKEKLGIDTKEYDYKQTAIVIDIRHSSWPHNGVAVEKFTPNGPFAILPKYEENGTTSSLVWVEKGIIKDLKSLSKGVLKDLIMRKLDDYLGDIELISEPLLYNLKLFQSKKRFKGRTVFVGDAAQSIHPIAGQGFNLGLRDVECLIKFICEAKKIGLDYKEILKNYSISRDSDVSSMVLTTTMINALFANGILPVKALRRLGLNLFDKIPYLKRFIMKHAAGI